MTADSPSDQNDAVIDAGKDVLNFLQRKNISVTGSMDAEKDEYRIQLEGDTWEGPSMYPLDPQEVAEIAAKERGIDVKFEDEVAIFTG